MSARRALATAITLAAALPVPAPAAEPDEPRVARAIRADPPPAIDGALDDPIWRRAPWHGGFVQRKPEFGPPGTYETEFAVAYDDDAIYFALRCHVPHRDRIVSRLTRRDRDGDYDQIAVHLDPRLDGRTGYGFWVNPAGVLQDGSWSSDTWLSKAWDSVFEARTRIEEQAWTAEMAIPLDELRFAEGQSTWGLQVSRWISELTESDVWNPVDKEASGWISLAGRLTGLEGLEPRTPLSLTPETTLSFRSVTEDYETVAKLGLDHGIGGFGKVGLGGDLILDLAINPDFGQVEVDAAVLNLSAYETRFPEKRPFFLEGASLFGSQMELFYSRRVGAPPPEPELGDDDEVLRQPATTPILAAVKITGRTQNGLSAGLLEAVLMPTEFHIRDTITNDVRIKQGSPWTHVAVARLGQEFGEASRAGVITAALNPMEDGHRGSYSGGLDFDLLTEDREYALRGMVAGSLRRDPVLGREANEGLAARAQVSREGGEHLRFWAGYQVLGQGFDPNDLGFMWRDDHQQFWAHLRFREPEPIGPFEEMYLGAHVNGAWNLDGLNIDRGGNLYFWNRWPNNWWTEAGVWGVLSSHDDRETRGGPPLRFPGRWGAWFWARTDSKAGAAGRLSLEAGSTPFGSFWVVHPVLEVHAGRVELDLGVRYASHRGLLRWVDTLNEDTAEEQTIVGRLDLDKLNVTVSGTLTLTVNLTLQAHAQLLVSAGDYHDYRWLVGAGAARPVSYPDEDADFTAADVRAQVLLRWEYEPGCALYAVYTQNGFGNAATGAPSVDRGLRSLSDWDGEQLVMIKLSHRFGF